MEKIVIVTGGGSGIGKAVVDKLAAQDAFRIYSLDLRHEASSQANVHNIELDMRDLAGVKAFLEGIQNPNNLYGIVANAGIHQAHAALDEGSAFREIVDFNVCLTFEFILEAVNYLKSSEHGLRHVILTSSASSLKGLASNPGYAASKAALDSMVRSLAVRFAPEKIYFNSVNPGWVETQMLEESLVKYARSTGKTHDELLKVFADQGITGKFAQPSEVADLVWLLMSPSQTSIIGQNIVIDNGYMLR